MTRLIPFSDYGIEVPEGAECIGRTKVPTLTSKVPEYVEFWLDTVGSMLVPIPKELQGLVVSAEQRCVCNPTDIPAEDDPNDWVEWHFVVEIEEQTDDQST